MNIPAKKSPTDIDLGPLRLHATGIDFLAEPTLEQWAAAFEWVARCDSAVQWWAGSMVHTGEYLFGEKAAQWFNKDTHRRWAWVCEKVTPAIRRAALTFSHHENVARLEPREQKRWLDLAEHNQWSANELKRQIKADEALPEDDDKIPCPTCGKPWNQVYAT